MVDKANAAIVCAVHLETFLEEDNHYDFLPFWWDFGGVVKDVVQGIEHNRDGFVVAAILVDFD
ncbi:MAG: hypothetical protein JW384_00743 [Nitrosomonadaceae bacterium]|nr:hypothetical protein [Nitrosomonadaceae bacterium]